MSPASEAALGAFPFSALTGYEDSRRALLCTAVDPALAGAILCGAPGSGRRLLVESFLGFLRQSGLESDVEGRIASGLDALRLEGGVDLERSLMAGHPVRRRGLLARHRGGVLLIENLDGLDVAVGASLARWLEGEGAGTRWLAIAAEPTVRAAGFARRLAFHVTLSDRRDEAQRAALLARRLDYDRRPEAFAAEWAEAEDALGRSVAAARERLMAPHVPDEIRDALAADGVARGRNDLRREMLALRAARAHAALADRDELAAEDLAFAERTVLGIDTPREEAPPATPPPPDAAAEREAPPPKRPPPSDGDSEGRPADSGSPEEKIFAPEAQSLPPLDVTIAPPAPGTRRGRRGRLDSWQRGRTARVLSGPVRGRRIALEATLREAAVKQRFRVPRRPGVRIEIRREDLRIRRFREKAGTLFILAVDASGSMAFHRMREAKGAALSLLRDAYVSRDAVSLIAIRGDAAECLLPPTTSLARARRELEVLPTGGGTPLASGLALIARVADAERRRRARRILAVIITDGRANVPLAPKRPPPPGERKQVVEQELERLAGAYRESRIPTLVLESSAPSERRPHARELARRLQARHRFLSRETTGDLADALRDFVSSEERDASGPSVAP